MTEADIALLTLLQQLEQRGYRFVAPTPASHRIVIARPENALARDLRDIFGWSLSFGRETLPETLFLSLHQAGMLAGDGAIFRSRVRVASLGSLLFLHSAFPTEAPDSVFFGPDSYRFIRFVLAELAADPAERLIDVGGGSGAGAISAIAFAGVSRALLTDVNETALRFARINSAHAGAEMMSSFASGASAADGFPLAIMNPPFIADDSNRTYRNGGGSIGAQLSIDWAIDAARRIAPGGRVLLYTGSAIVGGDDGLERALREQLPPDCSLRYAEIDPDIFGEELERPAYAEVERIAAVGAVIRRER